MDHSDLVIQEKKKINKFHAVMNADVIMLEKYCTQTAKHVENKILS